MIKYINGDLVYYINGEEWCAGLPVHLDMPVNKDGQGPLDDDDPEVDRITCWCGDDTCKRYED